MANLTANDRSLSQSLSKVAIWAALAGVLGFVGDIVMGLVIEIYYMPRSSSPMLSYGQEAGLISLPLCTMIGAAIGAALAIATMGYMVLSAGWLLFTAMGGSAIVCALWASQVASYGRDPSEMVLYLPPLGICALALLFIPLAVVMSSLRSFSNRDPAGVELVCSQAEMCRIRMEEHARMKRIPND